MKIYTKTGDSGETSLFGGGRVAKNHKRVEAYGAIDELNSAIGLARAAHPSERGASWLRKLQEQLFHLGSDLATPQDSKTKMQVRVKSSQARWLEETIDIMTDELEALRHFILPGGTQVAAHLHLARAICRRAERNIVSLQETETINPQIIVYVNRLSDWLFTLARYENAKAGEPERKWTLRS